MILFNAASAGVFWERLLVLLLEQRRAVGLEPPLAQPSEAQPGYSEGARAHLHRHRALISATRPTDLLLTDIRATHSRAMNIRVTRDTLPTPVFRDLDTLAIRDSPLTPVPQAMHIRAIRDSPLIPVLWAMDTRARRSILPTPVPIMEIPWPAIPAIALRRTGRLGPGTRSSLVAEFRPDANSTGSSLENPRF